MANIQITPMIILSEHEKNEMCEDALNQIHDSQDDWVLDVMKETFHEEMREHIMGRLNLLNENIQTYGIERDMTQMTDEIEDTFFLAMMPRRSYGHCCRKMTPKKKQKLLNQIDVLRKIPQPEQRTTEWYEFRYNLITASSAWKVFDTKSCVNSLIYEKCKPLTMRTNKVTNLDSPLHWGQKYEPVSVMLYEEMYNTTVEDFGCIRHKDHAFLGASPDGINVDPTSDLFGRMLEIKNIVNRDITGIPKKAYWIQMQLQMCVCELKECDFLETRFVEYESHSAFMNDSNDSDMLKSKNGDRKGMFICFNGGDGPKYVYPPTKLSYEELVTWETAQIDEHSIPWMCNVYWKLTEISCVLVCRNKEWFDKALPKISDVWDVIVDERINGCEHRAPVRRKKTEDVPLFGKCVCDILVVKKLQ